MALCCIVWSCILKDLVWHESWAFLGSVSLLRRFHAHRAKRWVVTAEPNNPLQLCMAFAWHLLQVIKPHSWGTHMLIVEGMKAYWTAAGLGRPGKAWDGLGPWDGPWKMPTASQDGNLATSKRCGTTKRALEGGAWVMIGMVWNEMVWNQRSECIGHLL